MDKHQARRRFFDRQDQAETAREKELAAARSRAFQASAERRKAAYEDILTRYPGMPPDMAYDLAVMKTRIRGVSDP